MKRTLQLLALLVALAIGMFAADRVSHCYAGRHPKSAVARIYYSIHGFSPMPCPPDGPVCSCSFWQCIFGPANCWHCQTPPKQ